MHRSIYGLSLAFLCGFFVLGISACATIHSKEDFAKAKRSVVLQCSASLIQPERTEYLIDQKGQVWQEEKMPGKDLTSSLISITAAKNKAFWQLVDSALTLSFKEEYELANDSRIYTLTFYEKGEIINSLRFSSGVPGLIKDIIFQLQTFSHEN